MNELNFCKNFTSIVALEKKKPDDANFLFINQRVNPTNSSTSLAALNFNGVVFLAHPKKKST